MGVHGFCKIKIICISHLPCAEVIIIHHLMQFFLPSHWPPREMQITAYHCLQIMVCSCTLLPNSYFVKHSRFQRPRSFCSAPGIETSGRSQFLSMRKVLVLCFPPILVPRGLDPSGLRQESRPLAAPNF